MSRASEDLRSWPVAKSVDCAMRAGHPYRDSARPRSELAETKSHDDRALVGALAFILVCCLARLIEAVGWSAGPVDEIVVALFGGWVCLALLRRVRGPT
jgi:hypothetical protein